MLSFDNQLINLYLASCRECYHHSLQFRKMPNHFVSKVFPKVTAAAASLPWAFFFSLFHQQLLSLLTFLIVSSPRAAFCIESLFPGLDPWQPKSAWSRAWTFLRLLGMGSHSSTAQAFYVFILDMDMERPSYGRETSEVTQEEEID